MFLTNIMWRKFWYDKKHFIVSFTYLLADFESFTTEGRYFSIVIFMCLHLEKKVLRTVHFPIHCSVTLLIDVLGLQFLIILSKHYADNYASAQRAYLQLSKLHISTFKYVIWLIIGYKFLMIKNIFFVNDVSNCQVKYLCLKNKSLLEKYLFH